MSAQAEKLAPHPWDAIASRIVPNAQTVAEAARLLDQQAAAQLVADIEDVEREIGYAEDDRNEIDERIGELEEKRDRLVAQRDGTTE